MFKRNQIVHVGSGNREDPDFFFFGRIVRKDEIDPETGDQMYLVVWGGKNFGVLSEKFLKETDYKGLMTDGDFPDWKLEKAFKFGKEKFRWFEDTEGDGYYTLKKSFLKMSSMRKLKQSAAEYNEVFKGKKNSWHA